MKTITITICVSFKLATKVKNKVRSEYITRAKKILTSKLSGGNTIRAINTWTTPVIHSHSDVDRFYSSRKIGEPGMLQVLQKKKGIGKISEGQ